MSFPTVPHSLRRLAGAICLTVAAAAATALASGTATAHAAPSDLAFNRNLRCSPLHLEAGVFNYGATPEDASVAVHTSLTMHVTSVFTVPANGVVNTSFSVQVGEIIEQIDFYDGVGTLLYTMHPNVMVVAGDPCEVPATHDVNVTGYGIACVDGTLHATMTVHNGGAYAETVQAYGGPVFTSQEQADLAEQHGFNGTTETFPLAPGASAAVALDFVVLDQLRVIVHAASVGDVFLDGPRSLGGGETGCLHDESVITGSAPSTTPPPVTPVTTTPAPTEPPAGGSAGSVGSGAGAPVAAASLPTTGGASLPLAALAAVALLAGGGLVRVARRRVS